MRTDKHEINVIHPLANIKIQPLNDLNVYDLKNIITLALDSYAIGQSQNISASVIHEEIKNRRKHDYDAPGYYLRLFRLRANLTQKKLAINIKSKQHHISEMEQNKRPIGKQFAKKLATVLGCDYKKFL